MMQRRIVYLLTLCGVLALAVVVGSRALPSIAQIQQPTLSPTATHSPQRSPMVAAQ